MKLALLTIKNEVLFSESIFFYTFSSITTSGKMITTNNFK